MAEKPDVGPAELRRALGQFPTGVCITTARAPNGRELGMTMSSFNSLSLEPPLVLFSVDRRARSIQDWKAAEGYAVNILADTQHELADRFAQSLADKWQGVRREPGASGAPVLPGAAAVFECVPECQHDGGDHVLFIARVLRARIDGAREPLVFCKGRYGSLRRGRNLADIWPIDVR